MNRKTSFSSFKTKNNYVVHIKDGARGIQKCDS